MEISRSIVAGLYGVLVDASPTADGGRSVRKLPYAASAIADLRSAGFAIVVLANGDSGPARADARDPMPAATAEALDVLDPRRVLVDYVLDAAPNGDPAGLRALERELGRSVDEGWVIADRPADLARGRAAGLRTALVATGRGVSTWDALALDERSGIDLRATMFAEAARHLLLAGAHSRRAHTRRDGALPNGQPGAR